MKFLSPSLQQRSALTEELIYKIKPKIEEIFIFKQEKFSYPEYLKKNLGETKAPDIKKQNWRSPSWRQKEDQEEFGIFVLLLKKLLLGSRTGADLLFYRILELGIHFGFVGFLIICSHPVPKN